MKQLLRIALALFIIIGGVYVAVTQYDLTGARPQAVPDVVLNPDVYPLYTGIEWGTAYATTSPDFGTVTMIASIPTTNITDIASLSQPFMQYYDAKLTSTGWSLDISRAAGGPGGEVAVYTNGNQFIALSFNSIFNVTSPDAPSQCPCDVQFTITSGTDPAPLTDETLTRTYRDEVLGFSVTLPTELSLGNDPSRYTVNPTFTHELASPQTATHGVQFTIPLELASSTNLSSDTYISVEQRNPGEVCNAGDLLDMPTVNSVVVTENGVQYSVASTTDAGAGNRYEEYVYTLVDTEPCLAVRYFIHYSAIENFPDGMVTEFDKQALLAAFDTVRRSLVVGR